MLGRFLEKIGLSDGVSEVLFHGLPLLHHLLVGEPFQQPILKSGRPGLDGNQNQLPYIGYFYSSMSNLGSRMRSPASRVPPIIRILKTWHDT